MNLSIVIPVFNEEDNLFPLYQRLTAVMAECGAVSDYQIVMVDDGSTDASAESLTSLSDPRLKVVRNPSRLGQSAAFQQGIAAAAFDTIATLDADLQNDPAELPQMLDLLKNGADFVQGWRIPRRDPLLKRISSKFANALLRRVLKVTFHDIGCSQRVFKKKCIEKIDFFTGAHRFLPYLVQAAGFRVVESQVQHHPRVSGTSKYGLLNRLIGPARDIFRLALIQRSTEDGVPFDSLRRKTILRGIAYLMILAFLLTSLFNINRYGYGDDEPWLYKRGEQSYQIVKALLTGHLRDVQVSVKDSDFWNYHPTSYALLNYRLAGPLLHALGMEEIASRHVLNVLAATLLLFAVFKVAAEMLEEEAALYSLFFLMAYPRFIAYAQYNPKDIPAVAAVTCSILYSIRWVKSARHRHAVAAGLWMGLGASVHLGSLMLFPLFPCIVGIFSEEEASGVSLAQGWGAKALSIMAYLGAALLTLYVLWPLLWIKPFTLVTSIQHFATAFDPYPILYFGRPVLRSIAPWHYYPFFLFACTPLVTWLFIGVGVRHFSKLAKNRKAKAMWFILLIWAALPVVARMNSWTVKYNEIRHIFIAIPSLMIMAGVGGKTLADFLRTKIARKMRGSASVLLGAGLLSYFAVQIVPLHPYEGEYFNEAIRLIYPEHLEDQFEFPVWLSCYKETVDWLNKNASRDAVIRVPNRMLNLFRFYPKRKDLSFQDHGPASYIVIGGPEFELRGRYRSLTPLLDIQRYRSRLVGVFKVESE